jgi:hypothetical protein
MTTLRRANGIEVKLMRGLSIAAEQGLPAAKCKIKHV